MTKVKICGLTNLDDVLCAIDAGADMLGFILYPRSPRFIKPAGVRTILDQLGDRRDRLKCVGVFVNEPVQNIISILDLTKLDLAQLSGDESIIEMAMLSERAYKVVRQLPQARALLASMSHHNENIAVPDLLLDADHPVLYGGSGERANQSIAATIARDCRLLLAGGLNPENVADAVTSVQPWGVDVASGVEASPGIKDYLKITRFIAAVHQADHELHIRDGNDSKVR